MQNPCLLTLDITNVGTVAIKNPPIKIRNTENIEIIPGYFEDVPPGYEDLWNIQKNDSNSCNLLLAHINPKQTVKVRFFLDNFPTKEIIFECPMEDLELQKTTNSINSNQKNSVRTNFLQKVNITLIIIIAILFLAIDQWQYLVNQMLFPTGLYKYLASYYVVIFFILTFVLSLLFNIYGIEKFDKFIISNPQKAKIFKLGLLITSIILLVLITFNYIIVHPVFQIITAIFVSCLLALLIHWITLSKSND